MIMFYMDKFQRETKIKGGEETEKKDYPMHMKI